MTNKEIIARPIWNKTLAKTLLGKLIIVGLSFCNSDGSLIEQRQYYGRVQSIRRNKGIFIKGEGLSAGEPLFSIPPDLEAISKAEPGNYKIRSTGEVVINPDYIVTYKITDPPK